MEQVIADAKEGLADSDNVSLNHLEAVRDGSKTILTAKLSFKDARKVGSVLQKFRDPPGSAEKSDEEILFGDTSLKISFPKLLFSRQVDVRPLVPPESINPMTNRLLGDSKLTYQIHLPTPATTHNADHVSKDGKSLQWQVPLTTLLAGPVEMKFSAPLPHLSRYLALAGLLLILAVCASIRLIKKRKNKVPNPS
ncbi:MAG: hypothetical protein ACSHYB_03895 [Roseibacillus sp.]